MMVAVVAKTSFVTAIGDGDVVAAEDGVRILVPASRAKALVDGGYAVYEAPTAAPENKAAGSAPSTKARKRATPPKAAAPTEPAAAGE